jgi:hypothetical protein
MLDSLNRNPGHCRPGKVAKESSPQGVAQGNAKALFQGLSPEASKVIITFNTLNLS